MSLHETQTAISDWVRAPNGVAAALAEEDAKRSQRLDGDAARRLDELIRSDGSLDATRSKRPGTGGQVARPAWICCQSTPSADVAAPAASAFCS